MTDEKYTFVSTVKERSSVAHGAFAKKGGSRSKACYLPHENLSRKERNALNGGVIMHNINRPMSYKELKPLDKDCARDYLTHIISDYHPRNNDLLAMFDCCTATYYSYIKSFADLPSPHKGRKMTKEWAEFIGAKIPDDKPVASTNEVVECTPQDDTTKIAAAISSVANLPVQINTDFAGTSDELITFIKAYMIDGRLYSIHLSAKSDDDNCTGQYKLPL